MAATEWMPAKQTVTYFHLDKKTPFYYMFIDIRNSFVSPHYLLIVKDVTKWLQNCNK